MFRHLNIALAVVFALVLSRPGFANEEAKGGGGEEKCMGGPAGSKCGGSHDLRVQFDKESAKGEIKCKQGKLKNGKLVYPKCSFDRLDKYDEIAIKKKIISKEKFDISDEKKKKLAKKLAFFHSARAQLKKDIADMGEAKKDDIEYKKAEGALEKIDKEFDKSLVDCGKENKEDFTCPAKD